MSGGGVQGVNILRSCPSSVKSYVKFCNQSKKNVSIEWIDNHGHHKCFCHELKPEKCFSVVTFVGHPWIAYESHFRHQMVFNQNRKLIYFPAASPEDSESPVQIVANVLTPLHSLTDLCLQVVHMTLLSRSAIGSLQLPMLLEKKLQNLFENQENKDIPIRLTAESQL